MLAADTHFEVCFRRAAFFSTHANELSNTFLVEYCKRIVFEDTFFLIYLEEFACVVARESESHLGKVVCTEREEVGNLSNLIGCQSCTRNFNHRTDFVLYTFAAFCKYFFCSVGNNLSLHLELGYHANQRNHNLRSNFCTLQFCIESCLDYSTSLHFGNFGICTSQTATPVPEHRVELGERVACNLNLFESKTHFGSELFLSSQLMRNEFVQRRVEKTYRYAISVHCHKYTEEVLSLYREEFLESFAATLFAPCENHFAHGLDTFSLKEHVFCTAETDTFRSETARCLGIARSVGIGTNIHLRIFLGNIHYCAEVSAEVSLYGAYLSVVNFTGRTVERNPVALFVNFAAHFYGTCFVIDIYFTCTRYAAFTHTAGNNGSVRCHTAASRKDTLSDIHTAEVFGRSLDSYKDYFLAFFSPSFSIIGEEYNLSGGGTRRSGETFCHYFGRLQSYFVEYRVQELVQFLRLHAFQNCLVVNLACTIHVHSYLNHGCTCTFSVTGLEEPELTVLYGKFEVLHILEVIFQFLLGLDKVFCTFGHRFFERRIFRCANLFADTLEGSPTARTLYRYLLGSSDTGNNVFALCIDKVFAVEYVFTGSSVAGKCNSGCRSITHIAEYHCLNVYGSTPFFGYLVHSSVIYCAFVHPAVEYGAYCTPQLFPRVIGEFFARSLLNSNLEELYKFLQVVYVEFGIEFYTFLFLNFIHYLFERVDVGFAFGFHSQHHIAVHLHETSVRVPCKAGISCFYSYTFSNFLRDTEVEDGVHHTGHGYTGTRTYRNKQRIFCITEFCAHYILYIGNRFFNILLNHCYNGITSVLVVSGTNFGSDGKTGRNGYTDKVHFRKVRTFSSE